MKTLAIWCIRHRWIVIGGWLAALVGAAVVSSAVGGSAYSDSFSLSGTESSRALDLLRASSPKLAGDTEQVVLATKQGRHLDDVDIRAEVTALLSSLQRQPHVSRIVSPYESSGTARLSPDRTVGFASVTFDIEAQKLTGSEVHGFIKTADAAASDTLEVAVSGQIAQRDEKPSLGGVGYGVLLAGVVLLVVFGSLWAMALPLLSALASLGTAFSVIALLSHVLKMPQFSPQLTGLVGLGVGVDYALFIVTRHRQGLIAGGDIESSAVKAINTSGRAVLFAGIIVCFALLGMFTLGVGFLNGLAIAASIGVLFTMLAAITLIPAMLSLIGHRVLSPKQRRALATTGPRIVGNAGFWPRWADTVRRRPLVPAVAALLTIVVLALPFAGLRLGLSDQGNDAKGTPTRTAYDLLSRGFGPGFTGPLQVVGVIRDDADQSVLEGAVTAIGRTKGVRSVSTPTLIPTGGTSRVALLNVYPTGSPQDRSTTQLIHRLRHSTLPTALRGSHLTLLVGGGTAIFADFSHVLAGKLPIFVGVVVLMSFLLLAIVFRSIVVPLTAAVMNLFSAAAAFGILVAVFQYGWLAHVIGVEKTGPVDPFLPVMLFAILFGLSMDYEVFLVARMHEEWLHTGENSTAVRNGLATTGKTITAAALIMILVFASFILGGQRVIKEFGLGLAGGIFIDAVIIRSAIIPSVMLLLGKRNWWFPARLDRILPRLSVEAEDDVPSSTEPVPV